MAEIRIKRIYEAPEAEDGFRVLIDRLWPRGISKERAALADWWKDIAPSPELRTWFGHKAVPAYMKTVAARLAEGENVTLLYGAKDPKINQAVVLRDWMLHRMDK